MLSDTGDAVAVCYVCGHRWKLAWIVARALFRRVEAGCYECGPNDCPQCNPRLAALWGAARGGDVSLSYHAPVNLPPDVQPVRPESPSKN